jgi:CheY-like chemotaxis protein
MVRLIDDLLDVSRINRGKVELRRERIDLEKVIQQAVETNRPLIDAASQHLIAEMPAKAIVVEADPTRLAQVFANLLNNAAKYTERGGEIRLSADREGEWAVIRVRDNGIGIPAEMLPRIFDMFLQVDRALEKAQGGLGVGLSLVKGLVELHGGSVQAHSDGLGRGSEFVVRLPAVPDTAARPVRHTAKKTAAAASRRRVLIIDDNRDAALSLAAMLDAMNYETKVAFDGVEAVEAAADFRPAIVLLDIGMPRLNGYDTCRRMRKQPWGRSIVIGALTGWGRDKDQRRSRAAGFDFHLVKPVEPGALSRLLNSLPESQMGPRAAKRA